MPDGATPLGVPRIGVPRIGVLGGTFDPVHIGHLVVAVEARHQLGLDRVLLVVANDPWQKRGSRAMTPAADRLAMTRAAVEGLAGIEVSSLEVDRGGPSYMVDTLTSLRSQYPGTQLLLIVGADVAAQMGTWDRATELPALASLVVACRGGAPAGTVPPGWTVVDLPVPRLDVSSSELRERLREGRPVDFLVPEAAMRCIEQRGLYAGAT